MVFAKVSRFAIAAAQSRVLTIHPSRVWIEREHKVVSRSLASHLRWEIVSNSLINDDVEERETFCFTIWPKRKVNDKD